MTIDPQIKIALRHELQRSDDIGSKTADEIRAMATGFEKEAHSRTCKADRMEAEAEEMVPHMEEDLRVAFIQGAKREVNQLERQANLLMVKAETAREILAERNRDRAVEEMLEELRRRAEG